jgi:hypothetical protein
MCLDALEMLPVQDYQPRIRFRLNDAVTVLKTIEHMDKQQLSNFSQRDMENIVNSKVQKLEAAFTAEMKTLLATKQKTAKSFTFAPSADDKRTVAQVEDAKGSKKRKIRRHRSEYCGDYGQDDHTWSSDACLHPGFNARKVQKGRNEEVATDADAIKSAARRSQTGFSKRPALLAAAPQDYAQFCAWYVSQVSPHDLNPLVDQGCQRSVGGISTASALARQLGIVFSPPAS